MAKRLQQESGEERVTAKSRPMMNLTARMPSFVAQHCRLGLFQDSDFAGDLEHSTSTFCGESYVSSEAEHSWSI